MAKDVNLTSQEWIDLIFEGKNKSYGAYTLRKSSPKRHLVAFLGVAIVAVLIFLSASLINIYQKQKGIDDRSSSNVEYQYEEGGST